MTNKKPIWTRKSDQWGTPKEFFDKIDKQYNFTLDPCANKKRVLKKYMTSLDKKDN